MKNGLTKNDSLSIKGVAILILMFHHLYCSADRFEGFDISFAPFSQGFVVNFAFFLKICVSIFAFITGYGLLKSISCVKLKRRETATWNISRLIKTMSGFWFIYIISFIVTMIIDRLPLTTYFKGSALNGIIYIAIDFLGLANFFGTPSLNSTWWYMSAAIVFILLVPVVYMISKKIGYLPIVVAVAALPRLLNVGYPGGINIYTFILPVIFGMIFADYNLFEKISEKSPKNSAVSYIIHFAVFGGISILGFFISIKYDRTVAWELNYGVIPVAVICFIRYCIARIPVINSILEFLGRHSMTIFLTHTFLRQNYLKEFIYSKGHFMVIFLVLFVLSTALALVLDFIMKLCKYDAMINKMNKKLCSHIK